LLPVAADEERRTSEAEVVFDDTALLCSSAPAATLLRKTMAGALRTTPAFCGFRW
jgi:hypothetical protein